MRRAVAILSLVAAAVRPMPAQRIDAARAGVIASRMRDSLPAPVVPLGVVPLREDDDPQRFAPIASAIVPGAGQLLLGRARFVGYVAVELLAWWNYSKDVHERGIQERAFKEMAREVARHNFSTALPDSVWPYYEAMRDYIESGQYSLAVGGAVVPETDATTYNGFKWGLMQATHPTRESALAAYEQIAVRPEFRWSWLNHRLEYDIFKRTTDLRNDANRSAGHDLLVIGANHVLSMVDAFASVRLAVTTLQDGRTAVGAAIRR